MLLLGSDAPQDVNVPGFSIPHALELLVDAGLTPYQALRSGTFHPAIFFGEEGKWGTISEGASADLILLPHNPLESVSHLQRKSGVMYRGTWLPEGEIQATLAELAEHYASLSDQLNH